MERIDLIEAYKIKIKSLNLLLERQSDIVEIRKLEAKRSCYRVFITDLERMAEPTDENSGLHIAVVNERTLGINSCSALIKSMPTDQAIQIMKSDITGQPQTSVIDGQLVVAYVR